MSGKTLQPSEHEEQKQLCIWVRKWRREVEALYNFASVPNAGGYGAGWNNRRVAEGLSKGYPDTLLDVASRGYHGLRIEMKRLSGGKVSPEQVAWISRLTDAGYYAKVCIGHEAAIDVIKWYLELEGKLMPKD